MDAIIEKLQDKTKVQAFGICSPEEQEVYRKAGKKNCLTYDIQNRWVDEHEDMCTFWNHETYAIKPDYKPEPEFVDLEIEMCSGGFFGVKKKLDDNLVLPHDETYLFCLSSLPNFMCFWYKYQVGKVEFYTDGKVASLIREGTKVYARFRSKNE